MVSYEIHDGFIQQLVAAIMQLACPGGDRKWHGEMVQNFDPIEMAGQ